MIIRPFSLADASEVCQLYDVIARSFGSLPWGDDALPSYWTERLSSAVAAPVAVTTKVIGFGTLGGNRGILDLFVHPDYQRMGVGSRLLAFLEDAAREKSFESIWLYSTYAASAFYLKQGYKEKPGTLFTKRVSHI